MALKGYKDPINPLPEQRRQKFTGGVYRGQYSALTIGEPNSYSVIGQKLSRDDKGADPFTKPTASSSYESSGVVGSVEPPDVGDVDDGR